MGRGGGEVVFKKESASFKVPFHNHVAELIIVTTKESCTWTASVDTLGSRERTPRHLQLSLNQPLWFPSAVTSLQLLPQVPRRGVGGSISLPQLSSESPEANARLSRLWPGSKIT